MNAPPSDAPASSSALDPGALVQGEGRTHLRTELMRESLVGTELQTRIGAREGEELGLLPWATLVNLGGSSICDRGAAALLPLCEALVEARREHRLILSVGGGARLRHTFEIGLDLGLPLGGLAQIAGAVEEQNAKMLFSLLAQHGGVFVQRDHFCELPKYLLTGLIPIVISTPPYHFWEPPARRGRLPENGSDLGAYLTGEVLGVKRVLFLKDQPGQCTRDPRRDPEATLLRDVTADELMAFGDEDLILERSVLEALERARQVKEVQVVNGLEPEVVLRALAGEPVGTIIRQTPRSQEDAR